LARIPEEEKATAPMRFKAKTALTDIRDAIATDIWIEWEKASGARWNEEAGGYENVESTRKATREMAETAWRDLKASWLRQYPFHATYEIAFVKGYDDAPEAVFAHVGRLAAGSQLPEARVKNSPIPTSWVSDYLTMPRGGLHGK
jgi:hypothetical protein